MSRYNRALDAAQEYVDEHDLALEPQEVDGLVAETLGAAGVRGLNPTDEPAIDLVAMERELDVMISNQTMKGARCQPQ